MQTIYSAIVLSICLNIGIGIMAQAFNVNIPLFINIQQYADAQYTQAQTLQGTNDPLSTVFIFGNFLLVAQTFINAVTGQWLVGTINMLPIHLPTLLIAGMSALYFIGAVWGLMYLIGGRGTKASD